MIRFLAAAVLLLGFMAGARAQGVVITPPPGVPASVGPYHSSSALTALGFGDSQIANAGTGQVGVPCVATFCQAAISGSPLTWISYYTNGRVYFPQGFNCGEIGDTAAILLTRLSCVLNLHPDIVVMEIGTNDASVNVSCATFVAQDRQIVQALLAAGITVFEFGVSPRASPFTYTSAQASLAQCYNQQRINYANQNRHSGYYYIPVDAVTVDPTTTSSWAAKSGTLTDGVHFSEVGGSLVGQVIANVINGVLPNWPIPPLFSAADLYDATNNPYGNLLSNGLLTGSGGSATGGCSGTAPTGWNLTGASAGGATCVIGVSTGSDGRPLTTITMSGTYTSPSKTILNTTVSSPSTVATTGDILEAIACINIGSNTNITGVFVSLVTTENSTTYTNQGGVPNPVDPFPSAGWATGAAVCIPTPRRTLTAAPTLIQLLVTIQGVNGSSIPIAATVTVQSIAIRKIGS